jgi:hypothetical protein
MQQELWYIYQNSQQTGPFPKEKIVDMLSSNMIAQNAFLFKGGWKDWRPLNECRAELDPSSPPPVPAVPEDSAVERPPRATINGQIIVHNNGELVIGGGVNISASGIFVETDKALFKVGEVLKLTCRVEGIDKPFNVEAEVMRFNQKDSTSQGYGLSFTNIDEKTAHEIDDLIRSGKLG